MPPRHSGHNVGIGELPGFQLLFHELLVAQGQRFVPGGLCRAEIHEAIPQPPVQLGQQFFPAQAGQVGLVHEHERGHPVAPQQPPERLGVALHAVGGADHQHRVVQHLQGALGLGGEIHMAGGVQQSDVRAARRQQRLLGKNGDAARLFQRVGIQKGVLVVHAAQLADGTGAAFYCRQMIKAFQREGADRLLLLGDLLYHGPRNDLPEGYAPKEVIPLLNSLKPKLLCVRGNCDAEVDQMVLDSPILADYAVLPVGEKLIYATHGHVHNLKNLPPLAAGDILLHGHTHIPAWTEFGDGNLYLNPGSLSIPKEGSAHSYMTLEDGLFQWKTLEGKAYHTWKAGNV